MSIFNDHRRCLEALDSDDDDARKLVRENLATIKMTIGKHKGKTFQNIFLNQTNYVWWVCNLSTSKSPTLLLFKRYCDGKNPQNKEIKPIMKLYQERNYKIPENKYMRHVSRTEAFCRFCDSTVDVKEKLDANVCSVCDMVI